MTKSHSIVVARVLIVVLLAFVLASQQQLVRGHVEGEIEVHCTSPVQSDSVFAIYDISASDIRRIEPSIAINSQDADELFVGAIVYPADTMRMGEFTSTNRGADWDGADYLGSFDPGKKQFDPTVAYNADGIRIYNFCQSNDESQSFGDWYFTKFDTLQEDWTDPEVLAEGAVDKPHMAVDVISQNYENNIYCVATEDPNGGGQLIYSYSTTDGDDFTSIDTIQGSLGTSTNYSANIAIGREGEVYIAWSIADLEDVYIDSNDTLEYNCESYELSPAPYRNFNAFGFLASFDGGANFADTAREILEDSVKGYGQAGIGDPAGKSWTYPVLAVDTTLGPYSGRLYLVWSDSAVARDYDIRMSYSDDSGSTWSPPVRVNNDEIGNDAYQYYPWVSVDGHGGVNVVFFDTRDDDNCPPFEALNELWCARSVTGGDSFEDFRVSEWGFSARCDGGGIGEYIGVVSSEEYVYPCWPQHTSGAEEYSVVVAQVPIQFEQSGVLSSDTTWKWNIVLTGDVEIPDGDTLVIERGARLYAADDDDRDSGADTDLVELIVKGTLILEEGDPGILITGLDESAGSWYGIRVDSGGTIVSNTRCEVRYASVGITLDEDADVDLLRGFVITDCETTGIWSGRSDVALVGDTVTASDGQYGLFRDSVGINSPIDSCEIDGFKYGVYLSEGAGAPEISNCGIAGSDFGIWLEEGVDVGNITTCVIDADSQGVHIDPDAEADSLNGLRISGCATAGIWSGRSDVAILSDTLITSDGLYGIYRDSVGSGSHIVNCIIIGFETGIYIPVAASASRIANCRISQAEVGIFCDSVSSVPVIVNCRIDTVETGIFVDVDAVVDSLIGSRISHCVTVGICWSAASGHLVNDTVVDVAEGCGIYLDNADPEVFDCKIGQCEYGVYAYKSSANITDIDVVGPGAVGIYLTWSLPTPRDTLHIDSVRVKGHFSDAHVYCNNTYGTIDSSEFITDIDFTGVSDYGMKAYGLTNDGLLVRYSRIKDFGYTGFYSSQTGKSNLGYSSGGNRIETSEDTAYFVRHWTLSGTPDLKALGNYWGVDQCPPDSTRFVQTNYNGCLYDEPFEKLVALDGQLPWQYGLEPNYPNPFNPSTTIEFSRAKRGHVTLEVFNILGQRVKLLVNAEYPAGTYQVTWNGRDEAGRDVAAGVYLYRVVTDGFIKSRKMVLLK